MKFIVLLILCSILLSSLFIKTKHLKYIKKSKKENNELCNVTEENLCCCKSDLKQIYWSTNEDGFCFYKGINVNCNDDNFSKNNDCKFIDLYCLYNINEHYVFD